MLNISCVAYKKKMKKIIQGKDYLYLGEGSREPPKSIKAKAYQKKEKMRRKDGRVNRDEKFER